MYDETAKGVLAAVRICGVEWWWLDVLSAVLSRTKVEHMVLDGVEIVQHGRLISDILFDYLCYIYIIHTHLFNRMLYM